MPQARKAASAVKSRKSAPATALSNAPDFAVLSPLFLSSFVDPTGQVEVARVADSFGMSKSQLAETIGLDREALYKATRTRAAKTQSRVREMLEIIGRVSAWAGGKEQAMGWYRAQPISAFGGRTAESLVKSGQAGALRDYLDHIAMGGFA
jgi:DNA-binding XRE family transcriptional regulator